MRCSQDGYVDSEHSTEFAESLVKFPARIVSMVKTVVNNRTVLRPHGSKKLPAGCPHASKTLHQLSIAVQSSELACEELPDAKYGMHTVRGNLHL